MGREVFLDFEGSAERVGIYGHTGRGGSERFLLVSFIASYNGPWSSLWSLVVHSPLSACSILHGSKGYLIRST